MIRNTLTTIRALVRSKPHFRPGPLPAERPLTQVKREILAKLSPRLGSCRLLRWCDDTTFC